MLTNLDPAIRIVDGNTFLRCSKCFNFKQVQCYSKSSNCTSGYRKTCKSCSNKTRSISRSKYIQNNPNCRETLRLRYKYGMSLPEYLALHASQGGVCAICKKTETIKGKNLSVDHCHTTGKIRGLLCHKCNCGIGFFIDSVEIMTSAISYLESSK